MDRRREKNLNVNNWINKHNIDSVRLTIVSVTHPHKIGGIQKAKASV